MNFKRCESVNMAPLYFKNTPIGYVHECDLPGITLTNRRINNNILEKAIMEFSMKSKISNYYHVIFFYRNCLQLVVLMLTDVSYGILNQEKCIMCM